MELITCSFRQRLIACSMYYLNVSIPMCDYHFLFCFFGIRARKIFLGIVSKMVRNYWRAKSCRQEHSVVDNWSTTQKLCSTSAKEDLVLQMLDFLSLGIVAIVLLMLIFFAPWASLQRLNSWHSSQHVGMHGVISMLFMKTNNLHSICLFNKLTVA